MGQQQSREESLYKEAVQGNLQAIKSLCNKGAGLEWIDEEGKTPLIVACMSSYLFIVAKTLIELGANVNSYCAGSDGGTPLHHAAKRGLHQTVKLLLSHGANPLVRNDDGQTPLDVARMEGFVDVVRAIEGHISFFSGWLREFYGPGFLEALAPQLLSRKIWVVIIPCGLQYPTMALKLELVIYPTLLDPRPHTIIDLWTANFKEPNLHQSDPALIIFDKSTKTRYRFASANDGDKQQLQWLYNACRGIPQVLPPLVLQCTQTSTAPNATQTSTEAVQLAMAISASIQSSLESKPPLHANSANGWEDAADESAHNGWGPFDGPMPSESSITRSVDDLPVEQYNGWGMPESRSPNDSSQPAREECNGWGVPESSRLSNHSSQPATEEYNGWGVPISTISNHSSRLSNHSSQPATEEYNGWVVPESTTSNHSSQPVTEEYNGWGVPKSSRPSNHSSQPATEEYNEWGVPESTSPSNHSSQPATEEYNAWGVPEPVSNYSSLPATQEYNRWGVPQSNSNPNQSRAYNTQKPDNIKPVVQKSNELPSIVSTVPSAPPLPDDDIDEDPVSYPSVDYGAPRRNEAKDESACVVCWEAPAEGACIPCGHMAACMTCLNEIKSKQGSCPVCRAKIDQVVKIYAV